MAKPKSQLKIVVIGDSCVGKTSILHRFVKQEFSQNYRATIGADFLSKEIVVDEKHISLQIWDTAGQERFQSLGAAFYRGADACILVYDITDYKSFDSIISWKEEFLSQCSPPDPDSFPFIVVGNKCDLEVDRSVSLAKSNQWALSNNLPHIETSAKEATGIQEMFMETVKKALTREIKNVPILNNNKVVLAHKPPAPKTKKCCK